MKTWFWTGDKPLFVPMMDSLVMPRLGVLTGSGTMVDCLSARETTLKNLGK